MLLIVISIVIVLLSSANAQVFSESPTQTMLLSSVANITAIDSFIVSAGPGGVTVFEYQPTESPFSFAAHLSLDIDSVDVKRFGDTLYLRISENKLYLVDLSDLPRLTLVDSLYFPDPVADFTVYDNHIYVGVYFRGIQKYALGDPYPVMVDSSMKGVLVTEILCEHDTLYALDEYNGIVRYDISNGTLHNVIDLIPCPDRLYGFEKENDRLYLKRLSGGLYEVDLTLNGKAALGDIFAPDRFVYELYINTSFFITVSSRDITLYDKTTKTEVDAKFIYYNLPGGSLFDIKGQSVLLLPDTRGGLTVIPFDGITEMYQGLVHGSSIYDLIMTDTFLILSGPNEPVKLFSVDDTGYVGYSYSIYENLRNTSEMALNGDSLFVIYPELDRNVLYLNSLNPDSTYLELSFSVGASAIKEMVYHDFVMNNRTLLMTLQTTTIDYYLVSDSGFVEEGGTWQFPATVTAINLIDTFLFVTNSKNQILSYKIHYDYSLQFLNTYSMSSLASGTTRLADSVYFFAGLSMYHLFIDDTQGIVADSSSTFPMPVTSGCFHEGLLFTAGYNGVAVYDKYGSDPIPLQTDNQPAELIEVNDRIMVISNGNGLYIHTIIPPIPDSIPSDTSGNTLFTLSQNYPNPFNAVTSIRLNLPTTKRVRMEIFNILGQLVATPVDADLPAGEHLVEWDGTNQDGTVVSTGVYFYRLSSDEFSQTKKMVLLK